MQSDRLSVKTHRSDATGLVWATMDRRWLGNRANCVPISAISQ